MKKVYETMALMCELFSKKMSEAAIKLLIFDLQEFSEEEIVLALKKCRNELKYFPTIADIRERVATGHLDPNEAWAICPKSEHESVCWTSEIENAYHIALDLIHDGDLIAARMAFIESYKKQLSEARLNNKKPNWKVSLGYNKDHRYSIIKQAIEKGLISYESGKLLLPDINEIFEPKVLNLINNIIEKKQIENIK